MISTPFQTYRSPKNINVEAQSRMFSGAAVNKGLNVLLSVDLSTFTVDNDFCDPESKGVGHF